MSTRIEWTDETWNPVTGCTKVSAGCKHCYAERLVARFGGRIHAFEPPHPETGDIWDYPFSRIALHPERLEAPLRWRKARKVFVCSMGDLFHEQVPDEFILEVFDVIRACHANGAGHTFQILTKRPARMLDFSRRLRFDGNGNDGRGRMWLADDPNDGKGYRLMGGEGCWGLSNVWLGVSIEDQQTADERIPPLMRTPVGHGVRFVSCEPLLAPVDLAPYLGPGKIEWVIVGGESGPGARPTHPDWIRSIRDRCQTAGIPFFFKQWGEWGFAGAAATHALSSRGELLKIDSTTDVDGAWPCARLGKKAAGRRLDGREWMEWPVGD